MHIDEWSEEGEPGPLVTREPQLAQARAELEAVRAELAQATSRLERCVVRAPFDALVRDRRIGVGQYVQPGQVLATLQEAGFAEAHVPLTETQLAALEPGMLSPRQRDAPPVLVEAELAGRTTQRWGQVSRTEGTLDQASRMLTLVIRVDDPLALASSADPLFPGQFVDVHIRGRQATDAALIPRSSLLADGRKVMAVVDGVTRLKPVEVAQLRGEVAVVTAGLEPGDQVQIAPAMGAAEGVAVTANERPAPAPESLGLIDFAATAPKAETD